MSADGSFFVDTNVLLYSGDPADAVKQRAAHQWLSALWEQGAGRLSWQVLHEFYVNVVSSSSTKTWFPALPPMPIGNCGFRAQRLALPWRRSRFGSRSTRLGLVRRAWYSTGQAHLSYWDGLIVAAAEQAGCAWLLSEDFQEGRKFGPVTIISPFQARPDEFSLVQL